MERLAACGHETAAAERAGSPGEKADAEQRVAGGCEVAGTVQVQAVAGAVVGRVHIEVTVVVEVGKRHSQRLVAGRRPDLEGDEQLVGRVGAASAVVFIDGQRREGCDRGAAALREDKVGAAVGGHEEIKEAVLVDIAPRRATRHAAGDQPAVVIVFAERTVAHILEQAVVASGRNVEVGPPIVVKVPPGPSLGIDVAIPSHPNLYRHVGEGPVAIVAVQIVFAPHPRHKHVGVTVVVKVAPRRRLARGVVGTIHLHLAHTHHVLYRRARARRANGCSGWVGAFHLEPPEAVPTSRERWHKADRLIGHDIKPLRAFQPGDGLRPRALWVDRAAQIYVQLGIWPVKEHH